MKRISRRGFLSISGLGVGAALIPSFLPGDILTTELSQSWYLYVQSMKCRTRRNAEAQLREAQIAGIDIIVYNVHEGGAHYNSAFYARGSSIEPGFDPLGYLVQRGNELGISIYAWMCPGGDCYQFNPDWDLSGKYGAPVELHWLDFSIPAARERVRDIAADITSKYPVGICLDYIRYTDHYPWQPLYRPELSPQDITTTVSMVQTAIAPRLFTAAVSCNNYITGLQDWFTWLRTGIIDSVQPMAYTYRAGQIPAWVARWDTDISLDKIVPILSLYDFNVKPPVIKTAAELLIEINECKVLNLDTIGFAFFDSNGLNTQNRALIRNLAFENHKYLSRIPF